MPSTFMPGPVQEGSADLYAGLKIQCFRRDPSKFFVDIKGWFESLNLQKIENWTCTADPSGHLTLIVAYRDVRSPDPVLTLLNDTIGLVCDLAEQVKSVSEAVSRLTPQDQRPSVSEDKLPGRGTIGDTE